LLRDAETFGDVAGDPGGGRGGQREHAADAQLPGQPGDFQVVGAEVVTPLADAVRLVDRQQRNLPSP
jgi:hypothetical protein